jgi:hypothetical protein
MKEQIPQKNAPAGKVLQPPTPKDDEQKTASGRDRWSAVQRVRLPHRVGLPLSSGGCGDSIER